MDNPPPYSFMMRYTADVRHSKWPPSSLSRNAMAREGLTSEISFFFSAATNEICVAMGLPFRESVLRNTKDRTATLVIKACGRCKLEKPVKIMCF